MWNLEDDDDRPGEPMTPAEWRETAGSFLLIVIVFVALMGVAWIFAPTKLGG